ncbi:MAG: hypothetical protein ACI376_06635 [Candidatus Bruticola sp.]
MSVSGISSSSSSYAQRAEAQRRAEEQRRIEEQRKAEERRKAEEKKKAEEQRKAQEQKKAQEKQKSEAAQAKNDSGLKLKVDTAVRGGAGIDNINILLKNDPLSKSLGDDKLSRGLAEDLLSQSQSRLSSTSDFVRMNNQLNGTANNTAKVEGTGNTDNQDGKGFGDIVGDVYGTADTVRDKFGKVQKAAGKSADVLHDANKFTKLADKLDDVGKFGSKGMGLAGEVSDVINFAADTGKLISGENVDGLSYAKTSSDFASTALGAAGKIGTKFVDKAAAAGATASTATKVAGKIGGVATTASKAVPVLGIASGVFSTASGIKDIVEGVQGQHDADTSNDKESNKKVVTGTAGTIAGLATTTAGVLAMTGVGAPVAAVALGVAAAAELFKIGYDLFA